MRGWHFIKNNLTLVFGIGFPVLLVVILSLAAILPSLQDSPQYDAVFIANYDNYDTSVLIYVENGKIKARTVTSCGASTTYVEPDVYIFRHAANTVTKIDLAPFAFSRPERCPAPDKDVSVPELTQLNVNTSQTSPDGYMFLGTGYPYNHRGLLTDLFFDRGYYNNIVLGKDSRRIMLPHTENFFNVRFIGWVIPQQPQEPNDGQ